MRSSRLLVSTLPRNQQSILNNIISTPQLLSPLLLTQTSSFHSTPILNAKKKKRRTWDLTPGQSTILDNFGNETFAAAPITITQKKLKESLFSTAPTSHEEHENDGSRVSSRVLNTLKSEFASKPQSLRQLRYAKETLVTLETIINEQSFLKRKILQYQNEPIELIDVNVSSDLRHATVIYDLPYTVPDHELKSFGLKMDKEVPACAVIVQSILAQRFKHKQYSIRLRFVRQKDMFGGAALKNDWVDQIMKELHEEDSGLNRIEGGGGSGLEAFKALPSHDNPVHVPEMDLFKRRNHKNKHDVDEEEDW
jgi:hypothetical protein